MEIIITKNYEEVSKKAADIYKEHMEKQPQTVLGFATGSTPLGMYEWLIKYHEAGLDFSEGHHFQPR